MVVTNDKDNENEDHLVTPNINIINKRRMTLFMVNFNPSINKSRSS